MFPYWTSTKTPEIAAPGFSIPTFGDGKAYPHRLVADYLSLSSHLQMRWQITPAKTATIRETIISILDTPPFRASIGGGNRKIIS